MVPPTHIVSVHIVAIESPLLYRTHESVPGGASDRRGNVDGTLHAHVHAHEAVVLDAARVDHLVLWVGQTEGEGRAIRIELQP